MNTKIIDLTKIEIAAQEPKKPVPIELVACLQGSKNAEGYYYFYVSDYDTLRHAKIIKKISELEAYKLKDGLCLLDVDGLIFLAKWNDGVLP